MIFFTILTLIDAIWEPVPDCGCFGDAIKLSNWETFYKNIILIIFTAIIFFDRKKFKPPTQFFYSFSVLLVFFIGFVWFSNYNLNHLPVIDFREWKAGTDMMPEGGGEAKIYLLYKNKDTGEEKEYFSKDLPWQDSVWMSQWEFVDQRVDDSEVLKAHELIIESIDGDDMTDFYIGNPDYQFILIAWDLTTTNRDAFIDIRALQAELAEGGYSFIVITNSLSDVISNFKEDNLLDDGMEFFLGDDTVLKSMIRANPGLILLKDGVMIKKWHYNDIPGYSVLREEYLKE